ncbi:ABC transporter G family member [Arachis hypogaea]|nr:ABC transporter G family member [Arachis hypogaea]
MLHCVPCPYVRVHVSITNVTLNVGMPQLRERLPRRSLSVANPPSTLSLANPQSSLLPPWFGTRRVAVSLSEVVAPPSPPPSLVAPPSATFSVRSTVELKQQGIQEERLQLLVNVIGAFRPGVLTGLVGVSRAGKTTLTDVLAGRKTGGVVKCSCSAGRAGKPTVRWTKIQIWFEDRLEDLPDDPNNELMIPEDPECNKEGELS